MAEGLQDAARAFQTEIAPGSTRPRDDGGRFVSTSRPEPMFEPRPIEGDPKTGDTRDGGEDARLAEIERRVADGRSEEGDERELSNAANARRNASRDERHERAEAEQGGPDQPGESDQDADREDKGERPEGDAGEDAEGEARFKVTTLDGQPVERFEVTVDGRPHEVTLDEALRGYIREQTFHQRMTKIDEARQAVEADAANVGQTRDAYMQRLAFVDHMLAELVPPEPDWDAELARDPKAYAEKQKAYRTIYGKRQQIANAMAQAQQEAQAEYDRRAQDYAHRGFAQFVQEANFQDEKTLNSALADMRAYGKSIGFKEGELATVFDPRMLRVLYDATLYRQGQRNLPKPVIPGKGKTLTPGAATPVGNATRRSLDAAQERLAKTGRLDDAAQVFQRMLK